MANQTKPKISYKIDRIINDSINLGLKTGANILASKNDITVNKILKYSSNLLTETSDEKSLTTIKFVKENISSEKDSILEFLGNGISGSSSSSADKQSSSADKQVYATGGTRINIEYKPYNKSESATAPSIKINLSDAYNKDQRLASQKTLAQTTYDENNMYFGPGLENKNQVVTGIISDQYGAITGLKFEKISIKDIGDDGTYDNFGGWSIHATGLLDSSSSKDALVVHGINYKKNLGDTQVTKQELNIAFKDGIQGSLASITDGPQLTVGLLADTNNSFAFNKVNSQLELKELFTNESNEASNLGLYKFAIDNYGRIKLTGQVENADLMSKIDYHSATTNGIVKSKGTDNILTSVSTDTYFYTSDAKWTTIPYNKVSIKDITTDSATTEYSLLAAVDTSEFTATVKNTNITINKDGLLKAIKFSGDGSLLTNLNGTAIASQITDNAIMPSDVQDLIKTQLASNTYKNGQIVVANENGIFTSIENPSEVDPDLTKNGTADYVLTKRIHGSDTGSVDTGVAPAWLNIKTLVRNIVAGDGGMTFRGTIGKAEANPTLTKLPTTFQKGDFYKIISNDLDLFPNEVNLRNVDAGDTVYAIKDSTDTSGVTKESDYWSILQSNLDNPLEFTSDPTANIKTGKIIIKADDSLLTYHAMSATKSDNDQWTLSKTDIDGNAATATHLAAKVKLWGQEFDGSADINGSIIPNLTGKWDIGSQDYSFNTVYAKKIVGATIEGTSDHANALVNSLTIYQSDGTEKEFNGEEPTKDNIKTLSLDLRPAATGYIKNIEELDTNAKNGNVISTLGNIAVNNETGVVSITPTYINALTSLKSSIFQITPDNDNVNKLTLSYLSSLPSNDTLAFYTGNVAPTGSKLLNLNGLLLAKDLKIVNRSIGQQNIHVASNKLTTETLGGDFTKLLTPTKDINILVNSSDNESSGEYGFIKSGISISNQIISNQNNTDSTISTTKQVKDYVDSTVQSGINGSVKCVCLTIRENQTAVSSFSLTENDVIEHVDVLIESAFSENELTVSIGAFVLVSPAEIDLREGDSTFSYKIMKPAASTNPIKAEIKNANTSGVAKIYVYYATPLN